MNRTSFARTALIAGLLAGLGTGVLGVLGTANALAAPAAPVVPIDPGRFTRAPLPPTTLPPTTTQPTFTVPPIRTLTVFPPADTLTQSPPTTTTPSTTTPSTTAPSTTTEWEHAPTTTTPARPHRFPKGAPETGGGEDDGLPPAIALAGLAVGIGGLAGAAAVVRRRRTGTDL